ncbi:hypothetical protein HDV00_001177 [Rhizophlyctis rosea]|nr:hypothetical protein HDV00_001177 [Rhizophlyctis rosea]
MEDNGKAVQEAHNNLNLSLDQRTIKKAAELYRFIFIKALHNQLGTKKRADVQCVPYVCLDIACGLYGETFPRQQALAILKQKPVPYQHALDYIRSALNVPPPKVGFAMLATRFGSTQIVPACQRVHSVFRDTYSTMIQKPSQHNFDDNETILAVFVAVCKALKTKVDKKSFQEYISNQAKFDTTREALAEYCHEELEAIAKQGQKASRGGNIGQATSGRGTRGQKQKRQIVEEEGEEEEEEEVVKVTSAPQMTVDESAPAGDEDATQEMQAVTPSKPRGRRPKKAKVESAAAAPEPSASVPADEPVFSGINRMVNNRDIRQTAKYKEYMAWQESILARLPPQSV